MPFEQGASSGVAAFDGLLVLGYPPDPEVDSAIDGAIRTFSGASPLRFSIQRERGGLTLLPDTAPISFSMDDRPSRALLPVIRELVDHVRRCGDCRVESSLRVQEFVGDVVCESVYVYREAEGIELVERERPAHPDERPRPPEISLGVRAESMVRKYQWPLLGVVLVLAALGLYGWQAGWWGIDAGSLSGPRIDAGVLERVVTFGKVRWRKERVTFELRPGPEYDRFEEAAAKCSLRPGVFRVMFRKDGKHVGSILPLDLTGFPEKAGSLAADESVHLELPWDGSGFDEIWICR